MALKPVELPTFTELIQQELEEWLQGIESKKIALHSLINQITVYTNATLEVTYNAGYLTNQTRALDCTPYGICDSRQFPFTRKLHTFN